MVRITNPRDSIAVGFATKRLMISSAMSDSEKGPRKRRKSITKLQRQNGTAAELIALCQTVTEDGHLEDQEIDALRKWLDENRDTDLPAVAFLAETVESILADGKVTPAERQALYRL